MRRRRRRSLSRIIWGWLLFILVLLAGIFLGMHFLDQKVTIVGDSMYPTLQEGDEVWIDKISYTFSSPSRFDIIVYEQRYDPETFELRRVIALPGETIQIKDEKIYINGSVLEETYGSGPIIMPGQAAAAITLSEGEYFVLGDNRSSTSDSREPAVGCIRRDEIVGRALFVGTPLRNIKWLA